ncbi:MAG: serine hydrolase domain-containing protein [Acidobacteriota bacterium]
MRQVREVRCVRQVRQARGVRCVRWVRHVPVVLALASLFSACALGQSARDALVEPTPQTLEEFQTAAARVLDETVVPGAGLALVRRDGIEWTGGIGLADRERRTPVTADTHFSVGSISKSFVALALVQLYEEGEIDLDATIAEVAPDVEIDNPWHDTDPVRVIHLLQHTAGLDDLHFAEVYLQDGDDELPLETLIQRHPHSRRVRWRPGTRMAYSNPGYAVAARLIEKVTEGPYEDYIHREIFQPLGMTTSSFRLNEADQTLLARGYTGTPGVPTGYPRIYLRPAVSLHSSPRELAPFVQMLLGWGELGSTYIVDPEYLGSMEQPRTSLAARAGIRHGYGTGIFSTLTHPYPLLGHSGVVEGFTSTYAYSPSRDVGFVILLNSTGGRTGEAMRRLSSLAIRYLKHDVELPEKPRRQVEASTLESYAGYYHDANPRNQFMWAVRWLMAGRTIRRDGSELTAVSVLGTRRTLIPVDESRFRLESELDASLAFTRDEGGRMVLAGANVYAERRLRWEIEIIRIPLLTAVAVVLSVCLVACAWVARARDTMQGGF